ncbi:MAG: oligopeptide transporter, OPT family [Bacteroidetes bacterium]|nr:oligopeptide transporter, OPT family [Bacteroidota bacterium]
MEENKKFVPFVPAGTNMAEFTLKALLIGLILSVILGAANAYIGLKAGMTIAATYPAAVIGMALLRMMKGTILEENFTRSAGSVGESVAAGAIFTLPAFYIAGLWTADGASTNPNVEAIGAFSSMSSYISATLILIVGGGLGVFFVALLRRALVQDQSLPFPESVAAAEIHKAGQGGGGGTKYLFWAMLVGAVIKIAGELKLFATGFASFLKVAPATLTRSGGTLEGGFFAGGPTISSAYLGVGYIIGPQKASISFSGLLLAWGLMVPIFLAILGGGYVENLVVAFNANPVNAGKLIASDSMEAWRLGATTVWHEIVRIIAIGGMLVAAAFTLFNMRKSLGQGLVRVMGDLKNLGKEAEDVERTEKDMKAIFILGGILAGALCTFLISFFVFGTSFVVALVAATVMVILAFMFAAVSGYLVGIVGSSNNPVSGLTMTALVITALLLVMFGVRGDGSSSAISAGIAAVLGVAAIFCVSSAVAGKMFQDLRAGSLLGGTPWKMQTGDLIGAVISGLVMFGILIILNQGDIMQGIAEGYQGGFGSDALPAPQATLMSTLSQGIVGGTMTWILILVGMMLAISLIVMGVKAPMLIFIGMFLPFATIFAIMVGGLIKGILTMYLGRKKLNEAQEQKARNTSVLLASGLIAGEALMGLVIAVFAIGGTFFSTMLGISKPSYFVGLAVLAVLGFFLVRIPLKKATKVE